MVNENTRELAKFLIRPRERMPTEPIVPESQQVKMKLRTDKQSTKPLEFSPNFDLILGFRRADPIISACADVTVDNVVGDGVIIETLQDTAEAELHKAIFDGFLDKNDKLQLLRNMADCIVTFNNGYAEVTQNVYEIPSRIYMLDTEYIEPEVDEKGNVIGYIQRYDGKITAKLKPHQVIHMSLHRLGSRVLGVSTIESVLLSAASKRFTELYNALRFANHKPRLIWSFPKNMGETEYNENVDAILEAKNDPQKDLFLWGTGVGEGENSINFKALTGSEDMEFDKYIQFLRQQIWTGMLVPPVLLGIPEGSNRANADIQMQTFDRRIRAIQAVIEDVFNREIIPRFGYTDITFKFDRSGRRDLLKDVQIAQSMRGFATLNEVRTAAGLEPLDPIMFPESEKIWNGASIVQANPYMGMDQGAGANDERDTGKGDENGDDPEGGGGDFQKPS